jgi:transcriptional regulator with XRE-family HTH domain
MLGEELRKARLEAGLTQEDLAFRARVSRNYVSLLELGAKSPTVETLDRICRAMGVRASVVMARWERRRGKRR